MIRNPTPVVRHHQRGARGYVNEQERPEASSVRSSQYSRILSAIGRLQLCTVCTTYAPVDVPHAFGIVSTRPNVSLARTDLLLLALFLQDSTPS